MYKKIFSSSIHSAADSIHRFKKKLGTAPGTVEYTGKQPHVATRIHIADYDESGVVQWSGGPGEPLPTQTHQKRWIQISGLSDTAFINRIGDEYKIPSMVLEDIVNPAQGAKIENCDGFVFVVLKAPLICERTQELHFEHLSILLFDNRVISFQESDTFHFEKLYDRLHNPSARMRRHGSDYFVYAMIDLVVDTYTFLHDLFNEKMDTLEDAVMESTNRNHVNEIHALKRYIAATRKAIRPLRAIGEMLASGDLPHVSEDIEIYIRDLRDHINGLLEAVESNREAATMLMESYLSLMSHRMNEVMKVLTMMSAIFIPLGFIAGLYGMNFDHMPELHFKYGYYMVLTGMLTLVSAMLIFFKFKKWI
ncbi:MAG: magnesium/cobalt transporter CorA [Deltaproteobacteria bacterium]|nr:magnesium/cobalt transporter CorA [Deltaproteobacteria bacterium]